VTAWSFDPFGSAQGKQAQDKQLAIGDGNVNGFCHKGRKGHKERQRR